MTEYSPEELTEHEIWLEGFELSGNRMEPHLLGTISAVSFEHACNKWASKNWRGDRHWDRETQTYWGRRLFPTREAAEGANQ